MRVVERARRFLSALVVLGAAAVVGSADAQQETLVDRAVVRFSAPEIGGTAAPQFIFQSTLALEARLEALADRTWEPQVDEPYLERHVRAALERHIGEVLLASLHIEPAPTAEELKQQTAAARLGLLQSIGGDAALRDAALAEGIAPRELLELFRRRAQASLYLHRMVAPMLEPSDGELRELHVSAPDALRRQPFDKAREPLKRLLVARRLSAAVETYFRAARTRLRISVLAGHRVVP